MGRYCGEGQNAQSIAAQLIKLNVGTRPGEPEAQWPSLAREWVGSQQKGE